MFRRRLSPFSYFPLTSPILTACGLSTNNQRSSRSTLMILLSQCSATITFLGPRTSFLTSSLPSKMKKSAAWVLESEYSASQSLVSLPRSPMCPSQKFRQTTGTSLAVCIWSVTISKLRRRTLLMEEYLWSRDAPLPTAAKY